MMMKKIVSLLLAAAIVSGMMPGLVMNHNQTVKAAEVTTVAEATTEAVLGVESVTPIEMGVKYAYTIEDESATYLFSFTTSDQGLLKFENLGTGEVQIDLCDTAGNELGNDKYVKVKSNDKKKKEQNLIYYGVEANKTYCVRFMEAPSNQIAFRCSFTKINDKSGDTYQTAVSLKKGKMLKGLMAAGESGADWYKYKVNKKQTRLVYTQTYKIDGNVKFKLYYLKKGKLKSIKGVKAITLNKEYRSGWKLRMVKGTYYLKVSAGGDATSGTYSIKVK